MRATLTQQKEELFRTFTLKYRELKTMKKNLALTIRKQRELFASFALQIWNEKLDRRRLKKRVAATIALIEEANNIVEALDVPLLYTLHLDNNFPETQMYNSYNFPTLIEFFGHYNHVTFHFSSPSLSLSLSLSFYNFHFISSFE